MEAQASNTLPKKERLCGKKGIENLLAKGRHGSAGCIRYIQTNNDLPYFRILISVPKKSFKRAVKRNLLKRRIRESWRRLKHEMHSEVGKDILFMYSTKEILPYQDIYEQMEAIVKKLNGGTKGTDNERGE